MEDGVVAAGEESWARAANARASAATSPGDTTAVLGLDAADLVGDEGAIVDESFVFDPLSSAPWLLGRLPPVPLLLP